MVCTRVGMVYGGTEPHFVRSRGRSTLAMTTWGWSGNWWAVRPAGVCGPPVPFLDDGPIPSPQEATVLCSTYGILEHPQDHVFPGLALLIKQWPGLGHGSVALRGWACGLASITESPANIRKKGVVREVPAHLTPGSPSLFNASPEVNRRVSLFLRSSPGSRSIDFDLI